MSANPYDLRAGLLGQAQGILEHRFHSNLQEIREKIELGIIDPKTVTWPAAPSTEDIIEEATKLYRFVQTK
tara:strand:+ start:631 stop:843 length:213 start_codon:yes stop_codon:yes gene_type:complete